MVWMWIVFTVSDISNYIYEYPNNSHIHMTMKDNIRNNATFLFYNKLRNIFSIVKA